jgi:hypothetical protein
MGSVFLCRRIGLQGIQKATEGLDVPRYVVNKNEQATGEHEVHTTECGHKPARENCIALGYCSNCQVALQKALAYFSNVDGCAYCCPECHKR